MKKFLSLVLALIMTMSLVTISAGAKDFTDADEVNYDEAIDVLSALKVVEGYPDESFKPAKTLTRAEAAKIICNMILGPTTAANLSASVAPFSDVAADNWAAGYITYCAQQGIISGYGNGAFGPKDTLTGYQFMKMLLGALGYDAKIEGYVGKNYSIPVAKQALSIGLNKGLKETFDGNDAVTREEACLYALNTLKADLVEYKTSLTVNNGALDTLNVAKAQRWNNSATKIENIKTDNYIQFAEQYFPKLELETGNGIYGRPTNVWKLKKVEIGSYTSIEPTYVYTEATENQDVYKDLGKAVIDQTGKKEDLYTWTAFVNGKEVDDVVYPINKDAGKVAKDDDYEYTGNGAVTEIYVDDDAQTVTVCEINYYLGQVSKVKDKTITVKALSKEPKLDDKTFEVDGYEEDDYVVFTVDFNDDEDFVIGEVIEPATVTGEVVRVENDKNTGDAYIKLEDGSKHTYSGTNHIVYDLDGTLNEKVHPELTEDYILYLDPNGFVLGFEKAEDTVDQYLYVQDSDEELHDWVAKVVLPDATNPKVDLKNKYKPVKGDDVKISWVNEKGEPVGTTTGKSNIDETVWAYTASDKGVYTLKEVAKENIYKSEDKKAEIHNGKAYITEGEDNLIVDKKTVFVDVDGEKAYTGYKEVPNIENATVVAVVKDKVAKIVFVLEGDIYDENSTYFMLLKNTRESLKYDGDYYWEYSKAYVNGEKTSLTVAYDADKDAKDTVLETGVLYKALKSIEDGKYITHVEKVKLANLPVNAVGDDAFWLTVNPTKTVKYDCDENTVFVLVEYTDKGKLDTISAGNIGDMFVGKDDDGFQTLVSVVKDANDKNTARLVYITYMKLVEVPAADKAIADAKAVLATVSDYSGAELMTLMTKLGDAKKALMGIDKSKLPAEKLAEVNSTIDALTNATTTAGNDYAKYLAGEQNKKDTAIAKETALKNIAIIEGRLAAVKNVMAPADVELLSTKIALAKKTIEDATTVVEVTAVSIDETALKAAEGKVANAKEVEKAALDAAKNLTGDSKALQKVVDQIEAAIGTATDAKLDLTALKAALKDAKDARDAAKADENAKELADAKNAAKVQVDKYYSDEVTAARVAKMSGEEVEAARVAVATAKTNIDKAETDTKEKVADEVNTAKAAIDTALTNAKAIIAADKAIDTAVKALKAATLTAKADTDAGADAAIKTAIETVAGTGVTVTYTPNPITISPASDLTTYEHDVAVTAHIVKAPGTAQDVALTVKFTNNAYKAVATAKDALEALNGSKVELHTAAAKLTNDDAAVQVATYLTTQVSGVTVAPTGSVPGDFCNQRYTGLKLMTDRSFTVTSTADSSVFTTITITVTCQGVNV